MGAFRVHSSFRTCFKIRYVVWVISVLKIIEVSFGKVRWYNRMPLFICGHCMHTLWLHSIPERVVLC